jgi:hypothetical protein
LADHFAPFKIWLAWPTSWQFRHFAVTFRHNLAIIHFFDIKDSSLL